MLQVWQELKPTGAGRPAAVRSRPALVNADFSRSCSHRGAGRLGWLESVGAGVDGGWTAGLAGVSRSRIRREMDFRRRARVVPILAAGRAGVRQRSRRNWSRRGLDVRRRSRASPVLVTAGLSRSCSRRGLDVRRRSRASPSL